MVRPSSISWRATLLESDVPVYARLNRRFRRSDGGIRNGQLLNGMTELVRFFSSMVVCVCAFLRTCVLGESERICIFPVTGCAR